MLTEEQAREKKTIDDLKGYFSQYRNWDALRNSVVHSSPRIDRQDLKEAVRWLKSWRERDRSGEEVFYACLLLFIASYVESDVENRFEKIFSEKVLSALGGK